MQVLLKVLQNSFFLTIAMAIDRGADYVVVLSLARILGVEEVGVYFALVSVLYIFQNLANFGLVQLATREMAKDLSNTAELLSSLLVIGLGLGILMTLALYVSLPLLNYSAPISAILAIAALSLVPGTLRGVTEALFNASEQMQHIAWVTAAGGLVRSGVSLAVLWAGFGVKQIFIVFVAVQWIVTGTYLVLIGRLYGKPHWPRPLASLLPLLRSGLVFVLMSIFLVGANNIDALLLSRLGSIAGVGLYAAAFKLVQSVIVFRPILMRSLFPSLVQAATSATQLQQLTHHTLRTIFMLLAPLPILLTLLAQPLILFLYGSEFSEATWVLQVLSWSILLSYLAVALHRVILAADEEKAALKISIVAMIVNVGMDLMLIPKMEARGAAIASLLSLSASLVVSWRWVVRRLFPVSIGSVIGRPALGLVIAASLAFLVDFWLPSFPLLAACVFALSYPLLLLLVGALSRSELGTLWAKARLHWSKIYDRKLL